jgi:hypothetical protein
VDITRDVMRMQQESRPLQEIRAAIDRDFGRFGPSTPTDPAP